MIRGYVFCARRRAFENIVRGQLAKRSFILSSTWEQKQMPPRPKPPSDDEFTESFLKGSGPGGQKINKTSSAVQLKHTLTGIVLKVQETRSRSQNRKIAREKLAEKIEELEKGKDSRKAIVGATKAKRKASGFKKSKRKYRLLEEEKAKRASEGSEGT